MTQDTVGFIGDIHGRYDLLNQLLAAVRGRIDHLVFLGDYVNRGPESDRVIDRLLALPAEGDYRVTLLAGHHDIWFLEALIDGDVKTLLRVGGASTIAAYTSKPLTDVASDLRAAVPPEHVAFLSGLQSHAVSDDYVAAHDAAADDIKPFTGSRYVVAGHRPQASRLPLVSESSALIDTGAGTLPGGRLTCFFWPSRTWVQTE